ncbi:MAG: VOC family protein [Archangium sp.]
MNLISIRLVCRELKPQVAFYEALTALPARWLAEEFAEIPTSSCTFAFSSERMVGPHARGAENRSVIVEFKVDDVDAVFTRVKGEVVQPPTTMPWGNRSLLLRDPEGTLINVFTPVTEAAKKRFA